MRLIGKLKEEVEKAETKEEKKELIEEAGMELDDEELEQVAGAYPRLPQQVLDILVSDLRIYRYSRVYFACGIFHFAALERISLSRHLRPFRGAPGQVPRRPCPGASPIAAADWRAAMDDPVLGIRLDVRRLSSEPPLLRFRPAAISSERCRPLSCWRLWCTCAGSSCPSAWSSR